VITGIINGETAEVVEPKLSGTVVTLGNHLLESGSRLILPASAPMVDGQPRATSEGTKAGGSR